MTDHYTAIGSVILGVCCSKNTTTKTPRQKFPGTPLFRTYFWFLLWLNKIIANGRKHYICDVFSHWLRICSVVNEKPCPGLWKKYLLRSLLKSHKFSFEQMIITIINTLKQHHYCYNHILSISHYDAITWKCFLHYWPFMMRIHSLVTCQFLP